MGKAFCRVHLLLKYYPLEYFGDKITIKKPSNEIQELISKVKNEYTKIKEIQQSCLLNGLEAYNYYVKYALNGKNIQAARTAYPLKSDLYSNIPFLEFVSVKYHDTVKYIYTYIQQIVADKNNLSIDEYFPLFQFTNNLTIINYNGIPIVKIYEADGNCVPNVKTTNGHMYVSYQYLLMMMFIEKFRVHLDQNREMYFNYGIIISNLIKIKNTYLTEHKLGIINKSVFGEFKIACVGSTMSYTRLGLLRGLERLNKGNQLDLYMSQPDF